MTPLKRFVLMLLSSILCFGSAHAADVLLDLGLKAGDYVVEGETITIPIVATADGTDSKSIAGAAFSVHYAGSALTFIDATSTFFGTFASYKIKPKKVTVETETYNKALVTNDSSADLVMIAAARPTSGTIPVGGVVLFELTFEAKAGASVADYGVWLSQSEIYNPDAGYGDPSDVAETPVVISALIDAKDDGTFPEVTASYVASDVAPKMLWVHHPDDRDNDGLSNIEEKKPPKGTPKTNPNVADTDGDGLTDGYEVNILGSNPKLADTDKDGFSDEQEDFLGTNPTDKTDSPGITFEVGVIADLTETEQTISFDPSNVYYDPVVVAGPVSDNEEDATFIQVYDVTPNDFKIKLTDAGGVATPDHTAEMVHWMAIDRGQFVLDNGKKIFAGKFTSKKQKLANKFAKVKFPKKFFKKTPVVLSSTNTVDELDQPAAVRLDKVNKAGFSFTLQEDSLNQKDKTTRGHGPEEISVIAFDTFTDIFGEFPNEIILEIGSRGKAFDDDNTDYRGDGQIAFSKTHSETPLFLAKMQTAYDKDSAQLRFNNNIMGSERFVELFVQEDDAIGDLNTVHKKPETVGYFATSPIDTNDSDGDTIENDYELFVHMTDPNNPDTDGDGLSDGYEINTSFTDPLLRDSDGDGAGDGHEIGAGTDPWIAAIPEIPELFFEVQEKTINGDWGDITFTHNFYDPIIVATASSSEKLNNWVLFDGTVNPAVIQMRKEGDVFQIRSMPLPIPGPGDDPLTPEVEESYTPDPLDEPDRKIILTIIERGIYTLVEDGEENVIIADSDSYQQVKKAKLKKIKFPKKPKIKKTAVVFASVASAKDDENPIYHRLHNVTKKGFSYMFQEAESSDQRHVILEDGQMTEEGEILNYIVFGGNGITVTGVTSAIVPGETLPGLYSFDAFVEKKVKTTNDLPMSQPDASFDNGLYRAFMLDMQSAYDKDPANVRYREAWITSPVTDPADVIIPYLSEDISGDSERTHKPENMGILFFEDIL